MSSKFLKIRIPKAICIFISVVSDTYLTPSLSHGNTAHSLSILEMKPCIHAKKKHVDVLLPGASLAAFCSLSTSLLFFSSQVLLYSTVCRVVTRPATNVTRNRNHCDLDVVLRRPVSLSLSVRSMLASLQELLSDSVVLFSLL